MNNRNPISGSWRVRVAVAAVLGGGLILPAVSIAAEPASAEEEKSQTKSDKEAELEEVQVTGSRILRRDLESNSPVITIGSEAFENRSNLAVESALNELPQFVPGLVYSSDVNRREQLGGAANQFGSMSGTGSNTFGTIGAGNTVGATTVSLRGLGANRNLVLMNGKRLVPVNASGGVDTSSIPASALQRVEVVTGGASSVYGADAVSGVINFILKDNFRGADFDVQYGLSELGDNKNLRISALVGGDFADGRGNAMLGLEYADRGSALQVDRDFYRRQYRNPYSGGGANNTYLEYAGGTNPVVLAPVASPFGSFAPSFGPSQAMVDAIFSRSAPGSVPTTSAFALNPDGTVFVPGDADGVYRYNGEYDGLNHKINQTNGLWVENDLTTRISSPLLRYSMFGSAHYDMNDSLRFYAQTNFAQSKTESTFNPGLASGRFGVLIPHGTGRNCATVGVTSGGCQNTDPLPSNLAQYGTWANVPTLAAYRAQGAAGLACAATGGCTNNQAFPLPGGPAGDLARLLDSRVTTLFGAPMPGGPVGTDTPFVVNLPLNMFGATRGTANESTNFQIITGISGDVPVRDWTFDIYTSHGTSRTAQELQGAISYAALRTLAALPNYGRGAALQGNTAPPSSPAPSAGNTLPILNCTSGLPVFSSLFTGAISKDCIDSVQVSPVSTTKMNQSVVEGTIQGGLFELPAGNLRFAAGASWRKNSFEFLPADILAQSSVFDGVVGVNPLSSNDSSDTVKDIFSELLVPVLADVPFAKHLNLELGYRYSEYRFAGKVSTWKALGDWAITSNFRLRGGYQKANRAPNLVELFENRDDVKVGTGDPCALTSEFTWSANPNATFLLGNATPQTPAKAAAVRALCEKMMGPAGAQVFYSTQSNLTGTPFSNFISFDSVRLVGNQDLKSEGSDTWTLGLVLRSPFTHPLAAFTTSIDYFKIKVSDSISNPQLFSLNGGIPRHCFDVMYNTTMDPNDPNCLQSARDQTTGLKQGGTELRYENVGTVISEGIDLSFNWSAALADFGVTAVPGRIAFGTNANYVLRDGRQTQAGEPFEEFTGLSGFGSFRWSVFNTLSWFSGPVNTSLRWRHYPSLKSYARSADPTSPVEGAAPYDIVDMSFGYSFSSKLALRAGVDNVLAKEPPIDGFNPTGGPGSSTYSPGSILAGAYDVVGRSYYLGLKLSF
ncbi:MAG: TonB-dependent receptor [Steroidobacteraceae bacterium]